MPAVAKSRARTDAKKSAATRRLHARLFDALAQRPAEAFAAALFAALMTGVVLNAIAFQNVRHPSPLFGTPISLSPATPVETPKPVPRPLAISAAPAPVPSSVPAAPIAIPTRPVTLPQDVEAPPAKPADPIGQIIRNGSQPAANVSPAAPSAVESMRILSVQKALVKLGYVLRPDGLFGASTRQAIEKFERERGWQPHGELTAKVLREIAARSGLPIE